MTLFRERLRLAMDQAGKDSRDLADHLGIKVQAIYQLLDGSSKSMNASNCVRSAEYLGVSAFWLGSGRGKMTPVENASAGHADISAGGYGRRGLVEVPVIGSTMGTLPVQVWRADGLPTERTAQFAMLATIDEHAFIVQVDGDEMSPRYNPGEYALVEPNVDPDLEDDVLVRLLDGRTVLRRLLSRRDGKTKLGAWNPAEPAMLVEPAAIVWMYYVAHPIPARRIQSRE